MNSTHVGFEFKAKSLSYMFNVIDEFACLGSNPKTYKHWDDFIRELKSEHGDSLAGVIIFSYKSKPELFEDDTFAFMLIPKAFIKSKSRSFSWEAALDPHRGRTLVDAITW